MIFRSNLNSVRVKMPGDTAVEAPVGDNDKKIDEPVTKRKEKNVKRTFWRRVVGMICFFQKVKTDKEAIVEEEKEAEATEEKKDEEKVTSLTSPKSSAKSPIKPTSLTSPPSPSPTSSSSQPGRRGKGRRKGGRRPKETWSSPERLWGRYGERLLKQSSS